MELELVGSCATLIAEKILNDCNFTLTEDVAWMLHGMNHIWQFFFTHNFFYQSYHPK